MSQMKQKLQSTAGAYKEEKAVCLKLLTQKNGLQESKHSYTRLNFAIRESKRQTVQIRTMSAERRPRWTIGGGST